MQLTHKIVFAATAAVMAFTANNAMAQHNSSFAPQMFANQYTQGYANQATAAMYTAPVPVPAWTGHTFYTYPALNPSEMMYWHKRRYHNYYDNGAGLNRTSVHYYAPPVRTGLHGMIKSFSLPRP